MDHLDQQNPNPPLADQVDAALRAFWRGSTVEFEQLLNAAGASPNICRALLEIVQSTEGSPVTPDMPPMDPNANRREN